MSQMTLIKKNMKNLDPNQGQLVCLVPDWVYCSMDLEFF